MSAGKKYTHINTEYLHELTDGDREFMAQIIDACLATLPENLEKLTTAVNTGNAEHTRFFAHKLKGSFRFIGSERIGMAFATIEDYSKETGNYYRIPDLFRKVLMEVKEATAELTELQQEISAGTAPPQ